MALTACSSADPVITRTRIQIVSHYDPQSDTVAEYLSVFADVVDPDGFGEIAGLDVEVPEWGVYWVVEGESLQTVAADDRIWYGAGRLSVAPGFTVPRTTVVVRARDLSGRSDETIIRVPPSIDAPDVPGSFSRLTSAAGAPSVLVLPRGVSDVYLVAHDGDQPVGPPVRLGFTVDQSGAEREFAFPTEALPATGYDSITLTVEASEFHRLVSGPWTF